MRITGLIEDRGREILTCSPGKVYSAHCTEAKGFQVPQRVMGDTLGAFHTGTTIEV